MAQCVSGLPLLGVLGRAPDTGDHSAGREHNTSRVFREHQDSKTSGRPAEARADASSKRRRSLGNRHGVVPPAAAAYPTDARERQKEMQKARKLAGGSAAKKKFEIEEHCDDCVPTCQDSGQLPSSLPKTTPLS